MNKKIILPIVLVLIFVVGGGVYLFSAKKTAVEIGPEPSPILVEEFNKLPVGQRPYLLLTPSANGGEIYLSIDRSSDTLLEYEIEYQATNAEGGTLIQGGMGRIDLSTVSQPTEAKEFCFCSESKGKKKYDTGVNGGSIIARFSGGDKGEYSLKGDFTIGIKADKDGIFSSRDAKVSLQLGDKDLTDDTALLVADTMGLPGDIEDEVLEGPYGFFASDSIAKKLKDSVISFQTKEDPAGLKLMFWNTEKEEWTDLTDTIESSDGKISAPAPMLGTYMLVKLP